MIRIVWSQDALDELDHAIDYIARKDGAAAVLIADRIFDAASKLGEIPTGRPGRVVGTYEKVVARTPYIIAYVLDRAPDGHDTLTILRVIHGARDWPQSGWPE